MERISSEGSSRLVRTAAAIVLAAAAAIEDVPGG